MRIDPPKSRRERVAAVVICLLFVTFFLLEAAGQQKDHTWEPNYWAVYAAIPFLVLACVFALKRF